MRLLHFREKKQKTKKLQLPRRETTQLTTKSECLKQSLIPMDGSFSVDVVNKTCHSFSQYARLLHAENLCVRLTADSREELGRAPARSGANNNSRKLWKWKRCENVDEEGKWGRQQQQKNVKRRHTNLISSFIVHDVDDSLRLLLPERSPLTSFATYLWAHTQSDNEKTLSIN